MGQVPVSSILLRRTGWQTDSSCVGGIIALVLGKKGWTVEDCIHNFERFAKLSFQQNEHSYSGWIFQLYLLLKSLVTDGIYPAQDLEDVLQEVLGSETRILDCSSATAMGIMIAITVTSMKPEPFIFTNYNGLGDREDKKYEEYGILLGSVPLWEMYDLQVTR